MMAKSQVQFKKSRGMMFHLFSAHLSMFPVIYAPSLPCFRFHVKQAITILKTVHMAVFMKKTFLKSNLFTCLITLTL